MRGLFFVQSFAGDSRCRSRGFDRGLRPGVRACSEELDICAELLRFAEGRIEGSNQAIPVQVTLHATL